MSNNLENLIKLVEKRPKEWRQGQAFFNYLEAHRPDLANKVRGTERDPFYLNDNVPKFIKFLQEENY